MQIYARVFELQRLCVNDLYNIAVFKLFRGKRMSDFNEYPIPDRRFFHSNICVRIEVILIIMLIYLLLEKISQNIIFLLYTSVFL